MELRHLKYFLAVAETQNIRSAAKKVHVTQPAISRKIKELEDELGVQLFDRLPKGLSLNKAGKVYQKHLGAVLRQIEDANAKVRQFAKTEYGSLALGAPDFILWQGEVTEQINHFRQANAQVELEVFSDSPVVLLKRLELGQIDGTFIYFHSQLSEEYETHLISKDKLVLAYPASWEQEISPTITIDELNQFPAIRLPQSADPFYFDWQEALFQQLGWAPKTVQWAHGENTMLGLVAAGYGVAIVNERHFSRHSEQVRYTQLDILPQQASLHFVCKETSDNPALATFLKLLNNTY
ncbi:LysR family transcriptional regulator [Vibrio tritonius]|uniref:LysR family transcriptional regulator n=1 Tax=Vibrio tritonius TaxID=1435069 RepID=UPI00315DA4C3